MNETNEPNLTTGPIGETVAPAPLAGKSLLTRETLTSPVLAAAAELRETPVTLGRQVLYRQHEDIFHTALVCKVYQGEAVNLKVTDENGDTYVVRSACKGDAVGEWSFPKRV